MLSLGSGNKIQVLFAPFVLCLVELKFNEFIALTNCLLIALGLCVLASHHAFLMHAISHEPCMLGF